MSEFKEIPETQVVFVSEVGPFDQAMPRGFDRLFTWLRERQIPPIGQSLAIYYDDPSKVPGEEQRCDTCVPVPSGVEGSDGVRTKVIGGCQVAAIVYQGNSGREPAYQQVYDWLREQGYTGDGAPFETYLSQLGEELRAEIAVPVKRAGRKTRGTSTAKGARKPSTRKTARKTTREG